MTKIQTIKTKSNAKITVRCAECQKPFETTVAILARSTLNKIAHVQCSRKP